MVFGEEITIEQDPPLVSSALRRTHSESSLAPSSQRKVEMDQHPVGAVSAVDYLTADRDNYRRSHKSQVSDDDDDAILPSRP